MKHPLLIFMLLLFLNSCRKIEKPSNGETTLVDMVLLQLRDSISPSDYYELDVQNASLTRFKTESFSLLRIPFRTSGIESNFLLLKIEQNQKLSLGRIITVEQQNESGSTSQPGFDGYISISSLKGELMLKSPIKNGFIEAFHIKESNGALKESVVEVPLMPEVVVVARYPSNSWWTYTNWYNLISLMNLGETQPGGGGSGGGYYSNSSPDPGSSTQEDQPIFVDFELDQALPAIDLTKYLKCFQNIPDAGATCSIKLLTDLPVDSDPSIFFNWENGSPGHTFLQITKSNGGQSVQQNIGFYPVSGWKNAFTTAPSEGKFVDNANHEFNASITMNLTPEEFQSTLTHMLYLAHFIKYDIDEYNCTDFSLEVFNYKRGSNKLIIPMYDLPGGTALNGTATPQGLYQKLKAIKDKGEPSASNVIIPGAKGFVGHSTGSCN